MRYLGIGLSAILLVVSLFGTGCSSKSADASPVLAPHRTDVHFLMNRTNGLVAYVPEGSVSVGVKVDSSVTKPYVEVPKEINKDNRFLGPLGKEYIVWGLGGTLYVRDVQQVRELLLVQ